MADLVAPDSASPRIGAWDHALVEPNLEDAEIRHTFAPLGQLPVIGRVESAYRQRFRLKSWQYMTAVCDDLFIAFVVGTAGFASNGFVYAAELPGGKVHKKFAITPLMMGTVIAPSSAAGEHRFAARGLGVAIDNLDGGRQFAARINAKTEEGGTLDGELAFTSAPAAEHLSQCVPLPGGRWSYTHKFAAFSVSGHVNVDGRRVTFAPGRSFGTLDFTKMYALRHAVWRWIAACGTSTRGAVIGLNLVDPTPMAAVSENAVWIDGKREAVTEVHLDAEEAGPWRIGGDNIDVQMRAIAAVEQRLDVPLVRHRLRHVVGAFSGHVRTASGQIHDLDSIVGIAEDYDTWW
ncbi:MAG: DUF2804 domain-containing protein [Deltaproteobacteria bacterium]|nr:DUF2804 domain-containing protein [Deltaproteobacteria bacterium]MDQ3301113.1 DUF2804 domain-containing protein [Myxococcota bacterium]